MKIRELFETEEKTVIDISIITDGNSETLFTAEMSNKAWTGNFDCSFKKLTTLKGSPNSVTGHFKCSSNFLSSIEGAPISAGKDFVCSHNNLSSLEGAPISVGKDFVCSYNKLTSLKDVHKYIKDMNGTFYCYINPIKSHVLGVLKIKGCKEIALDDRRLQTILNKYLPLGNIYDCQEELINAGFEEFAQL